MEALLKRILAEKNSVAILLRFSLYLP